jgi:hypothetical protein
VGPKQAGGWRVMAGSAAGGRGGGAWGPGRGGAGGLRRGCSPPVPAGSPRAGLQPLRATVPFQLQQPHQRRDGGGHAGEPGLERVLGGGEEDAGPGEGYKEKYEREVDGGEEKERCVGRWGRAKPPRDREQEAVNVGCDAGTSMQVVGAGR